MIVTFQKIKFKKKITVTLSRIVHYLFYVYSKTKIKRVVFSQRKHIVFITEKLPVRCCLKLKPNFNDLHTNSILT